ncbi:MAG: VacJ family lipoprotein [Desulfobacteraceae bacterium]|nr:VacJ family lipoprotein [Desulfobacteraceae bacterium]
MKYYLNQFGILIIVLFFLFTGCASQKGAAANPASVKLALNSNQPVQTGVLASASETQEQLSPEEEMLLTDDWADSDDEDNEAELYSIPDPFEKFNRASFYLNDKLYFWVLRPLSAGYRDVVPQKARIGVSNFFQNLKAPIRLVNNILQGKGRAAEAELTKFLYNSTVGILGFANPAKKHPKLNPDPEDLGQTFAVHGLGHGFYLYLPIIGPSSLRDITGATGDYFLNPASHIQPLEASLAAGGVRQINTFSFLIGDYESFKEAALDPYESMRDVYIQLRETKIKR